MNKSCGSSFDMFGCEFGYWTSRTPSRDTAKGELLGPTAPYREIPVPVEILQLEIHITEMYPELTLYKKL
jgi:hypothetical protein